MEHPAFGGVAAGGGDTVVVRDGVYSGQSTVHRGFASPVLVRAENPYQAVLTNVDGGGEALRVCVELRLPRHAPRRRARPPRAWV